MSQVRIWEGRMQIYLLCIGQIKEAMADLTTSLSDLNFRGLNHEILHDSTNSFSNQLWYKQK